MLSTEDKAFAEGAVGKQIREMFQINVNMNYRKESIMGCGGKKKKRK